MRVLTNLTDEGLDPQVAYWRYGGADCLGTRRIFDLLYPQLSPADRILYDSAIAFEAPCLAMALRGLRVDGPGRAAASAACVKEEAAAVAAVNAHPILQESWDVTGARPKGSVCESHPARGRHVWTPRGEPSTSQVCKHCGGPRLVASAFNPHSSAQCCHLFYDLLGCRVRHSKKYREDGSRPITADDEALEAIAVADPEYAPLVDLILAARGARKQQLVLKAYLDPDGRWRQTTNICAAETGRASSSKSAYQRGGNIQNIAEWHRGIFLADPGLVMVYADIDAAESTIVAHDAQCPHDIEDHLAGDAHTGLAMTLFPDRPWHLIGKPGPCPACDGTGTFQIGLNAGKTCDVCRSSGKHDQIKARHIAASPTPFGTSSQNSSWRQIAKVTRHGTNIGMSANGVARQLHQSPRTGKDMRDRYFLRYPENLSRQLEIRRTVRDTGVLIGPLGNTRRFLGRLWDDTVQRKALAQIQQSTVAWMINLALWRVWYELDGQLNFENPPRLSDPNRVWLLAQVHDALLFQVRPDDLATLRRVKEIMETPVLIQGKPLALRTEFAWGASWSHSSLTPVHL